MSNFHSGQQLKCAGLDMQCRPTTESVKFVEYLSAPETHTTHDGKELVMDCVIVSGSLRIKAASADLTSTI